MKRARWLIVSSLVLGCVPRTRDTAQPDPCGRDPNVDLRAMSDTELNGASQVSHVVAGRVRWTGTATANEYGTVRGYRYVIVDIDEFLRGDAWSVAPRYRRSFPLLSLVYTRTEDGEDRAPRDRRAELMSALECRNGESYVFFVELPGEERLRNADGSHLPGPVERAFGSFDVPLHAVVPASERERVQKSITK